MTPPQATWAAKTCSWSPKGTNGRSRGSTTPGRPRSSRSSAASSRTAPKQKRSCRTRSSTCGGAPPPTTPAAAASAPGSPPSPAGGPSTACDRERAAPPAADWDQTAEEAESRSAGGDVRRALGSLGEPQKTVILLSYFGGLSHSRIADATGLPLGTVKSTIRQALARLRTILEER